MVKIASVVLEKNMLTCTTNDDEHRPLITERPNKKSSIIFSLWFPLQNKEYNILYLYLIIFYLINPWLLVISHSLSLSLSLSLSVFIHLTISFFIHSFIWVILTWDILSSSEDAACVPGSSTCGILIDISEICIDTCNV